jgi:predicted MPP superfamily phosphohydrolase
VASSRGRALAGAAAAAGGLAAWGLFEAQWVQRRVLDVPVPGLPERLAGVTILHLSDFHAGTPSLNMRSLRKAVSFGVEQEPDVVAVTGDILSHPRAERPVTRELARLRPRYGMYAVLGNHDVRATNDPFSRGVVVRDWGAAPVRLLRDESALVEIEGVRVEIAGMDAESFLDPGALPHRLFRAPDAFRILLAHFPDAASRLPAGSCQLMLGGHLHGGQICLPAPGGKLRLSHRRWRFDEGVFRAGALTVVVSRGTGTTLVPFRLLARPEVALLRLVPAPDGATAGARDGAG